jgi:hypothetical protein
VTPSGIVEAYAVSSATVAAAIAAVLWIVRAIRRAIRWVRAIHNGVLTALESQGEAMDMMAGRASAVGISSRRTQIHGALMRAREAIRRYKE